MKFILYSFIIVLEIICYWNVFFLICRDFIVNVFYDWKSIFWYYFWIIYLVIRVCWVFMFLFLLLVVWVLWKVRILLIVKFVVIYRFLKVMNVWVGLLINICFFNSWGLIWNFFKIFDYFWVEKVRWRLINCIFFI